MELDDSVLRLIALPVMKPDSLPPNCIKDMFRVLMEHEGAVGLAGPQVGLQRMLFITRVPGDKPRGEEGCLSLPGLYRRVKRFKEITLTAFDSSFSKYTLTASGLLARVIQHEYDHLMGMLFIDRAEDDESE
jgi:peptide deformylase